MVSSCMARRPAPLDQLPETEVPDMIAQSHIVYRVVAGSGQPGQQPCLCYSQGSKLGSRHTLPMELFLAAPEHSRRGCQQANTSCSA